MEVNRGSYSAEFGDRTYGVFNIVPRTGFERNNEAELILSAGNFYQTNDQLSFGSHTERFAYYASLNVNRSNLGIQTPVPQTVHDAANGYGGFGSLIFNVDPSNQLRFVTSLRKDYYQIPYDPFPNDIENAPIPENDLTAQYPSIGLRDGDHESDAIVNFSWVHTFNSKLLLTVSPFYHYNRPTMTARQTILHFLGGELRRNRSKHAGCRCDRFDPTVFACMAIRSAHSRASSLAEVSSSRCPYIQRCGLIWSSQSWAVGMRPRSSRTCCSPT